MRNDQAQRAMDALAAQAVRRANALPDDDQRRPAAEAEAFKLVKEASEPPLDRLPDVLDADQARALLRDLQWRG